MNPETVLSVLASDHGVEAHEARAAALAGVRLDTPQRPADAHVLTLLQVHVPTRPSGGWRASLLAMAALPLGPRARGALSQRIGHLPDIDDVVRWSATGEHTCEGCGVTYPRAHVGVRMMRAATVPAGDAPHILSEVRARLLTAYPGKRGEGLAAKPRASGPGKAPGSVRLVGLPDPQNACPACRQASGLGFTGRAGGWPAAVYAGVMRPPRMPEGARATTDDGRSALALCDGGVR